MKDKNKNLDLGKIIITIIFIYCIIFVIQKGINILKNISQICVIDEGSIKFEETAEAYILRDEILLKGENYKNGMIQIIPEGQRVAKDSAVFRYYSNGEEDLLNKIATLDDEINATIESSGLMIFSTDIKNLDVQIEKVVNSMYNLNDIEEIKSKKSELENYITKKTKITGDLSPADSRLKTLIEQRNNLEGQIGTGSEIIKAPAAGIVSYRIDDLEEILKTNDFNYLNRDFLEKLNIKLGSIIPTNTEKGKIINNFECYIACIINTEKASVAQIGDKVKLRLPSGEEIDATIVHITVEKDNNRVIVFRIIDKVEELIQYRKISVDIIWWSYTGLKISNSAILEDNDIAYVERNKAGYTDKIYVKIKRQNDTYSIVENYTNEELKELGISDEYISKRSLIKVYDEILIH